MPRTRWSTWGLATFLSLVFAGGAASAVQTRLPEADIPDGIAVPVTLGAFKDGFRMCSRPGPSSVTSYSMPQKMSPPSHPIERVFEGSSVERARWSLGNALT